MNTRIYEARLAVIGLGYVGLPLAVAFGRQLPTVGFDINASRIQALKQGVDSTLEMNTEELAAARHLSFTTDTTELERCNVFIITVPTPVDGAMRPDLRPLIAASRTVGTALRAGDVVIYESTVYPGATEEVCVPVLESVSGLKFNQDFYAGYSPERINPGDKQHRLEDICKVTSGSTPEITEFVDALYRRVIRAGTHKVSNLKAAEAAKVIENTQRDVNIALMNELALIFHKMGLDTLEVLEAAGSKWNFLPFRPGLVGGHCIGVDPYYLTHKAQELGYHPEVILAGRRVNDLVGHHVAERTVKLMAQQGCGAPGAAVLILGLTFKENCPDLRNTRVVDIVAELKEYGVRVSIMDPWADPDEARHEYGLDLITQTPDAGCYDGVIVAVGHQQFKDWGAARIRGFCKPNGVVFDVKSLFDRDETNDRL